MAQSVIARSSPGPCSEVYALPVPGGRKPPSDQRGWAHGLSRDFSTRCGRHHAELSIRNAPTPRTTIAPSDTRMATTSAVMSWKRYTPVLKATPAGSALACQPPSPACEPSAGGAFLCPHLLPINDIPNDGWQRARTYCRLKTRCQSPAARRII